MLCQWLAREFVNLQWLHSGSRCWCEACKKNPVMMTMSCAESGCRVLKADPVLLHVIVVAGGGNRVAVSWPPTSSALSLCASVGLLHGGKYGIAA